jgi:death on curing protein
MNEPNIKFIPPFPLHELGNRKLILLTEEIIKSIHEQQIGEHGGIYGVNSNNLSLVVNSPRKHIQYINDKPSLFELASEYGWTIVRRHPFSDGNKRTCYGAMKTFLRLNGQNLTPPSPAEAIDFIKNLAATDPKEPEEPFKKLLAQWLKDNCNGTIA